MTSPDITIVLNAHREGTLLSSTLRSLTDTALHAGAKGLTVELVAVLDMPDAVTRAVLKTFESEAFVRIEKLEVQNRSLGPSRNAGLAIARGAFTAIVDGDDLYSFNYLAALHATVAGGECVVALPEFTIWFDQDCLVQRFPSLARAGRLRLLGHHTFVSCIMAPTAFLRELAYRDCAGGRVFAYEDYDLNCRAVAAGADIRTAEDAVFFYRRHGRSIMAGIADATRFIVPPNALFDPDAVAAIEEGDDVVRDAETLRPGLLAYRASHRLAEIVAHASEIEPRIDLARVRQARVWATAMFDRGFGAAYRDLCRQLRGASFDAVLVVASLANCAPSLARLTETAGRWLIVEARGTAPALSEGSQAIALDACAALPAPRRAEMIVRLIHAFAWRARLHLVLGGDDVLAFAEALECNNIVVYAPSGAPEPGAVLAPDAYAAIDLVVSDDETILDTLVARVPIYAGKVMALPELRTQAQASEWLARAESRLSPRPEATRWKS